MKPFELVRARAVLGFESLAELVRTPLMLWVAILAFRDGVSGIDGAESIEATRRLSSSTVSLGPAVPS